MNKGNEEAERSEERSPRARSNAAAAMPRYSARAPERQARQRLGLTIRRTRPRSCPWSAPSWRIGPRRRPPRAETPGDPGDRVGEDVLLHEDRGGGDRRDERADSARPRRGSRRCPSMAARRSNGRRRAGSGAGWRGSNSAAYSSARIRSATLEPSSGRGKATGKST